MTTPQPVSAGRRRVLSVLAHAGGVFLFFLAPLAIRSFHGPRDAHVRAQSTEALNFQIGLFGTLVLSIALVPVLVGILMIIGVLVTNLVFSTMAAVAAAGGHRFRYPFTVRLLR